MGRPMSQREIDHILDGVVVKKVEGEEFSERDKEKLSQLEEGIYERDPRTDTIVDEDPWEDFRDYLTYGSWWVTKRQDLVQFVGPTETSFLHKNAPKSIEAQLLAEPKSTIWHLLPKEATAVYVVGGVVRYVFFRGLDNTCEQEGLRTNLPEGFNIRPEWSKTPLEQKFIKLRN